MDKVVVPNKVERGDVTTLLAQIKIPITKLDQKIKDDRLVLEKPWTVLSACNIKNGNRRFPQATWTGPQTT